MKKIYLFLLSLIFTMGGVRAAVSFDADKFYYIIENSTGRYVATGVAGSEGTYGLRPEGLTNGTYFKFASDGEGHFNITTESGAIFGASSWNTSTTATAWTITETTDGLYTFYQNTSGNTGYLEYQSTHKESLYVNGGSGSATNKFQIVEIKNADIWRKPVFGGVEWIWNTSTNVFDATGYTSTASPERQNNKGPLYIFNNVGTLTANTNGANSSDAGGAWIIGENSNVTVPLGSWAGGVVVDKFAVASISWGISLKGTEPTKNATLWVDGTLNITGRTDFDMNDGNQQNWYIGERGVINTAFTSVTKGSRQWNIQAVVTDDPVVAGMQQTETTMTKKVLTWGGDISSNINSIQVWYKDAEGNYRVLNDSVSYDATGITVTYTGKANAYNYTVNVVGPTAEGAVSYGGNTYANGQTFQSVGLLSASDLTSVAVADYYDGVISLTRVDDVNFVVNVQYPLIDPIVPTTITDGQFADNTTWYRLIINRSAGKKYARYNTSTTQTPTSTTKYNDPYSLFCFVKVDGVEHGYKMYNFMAGANKAYAQNSSDGGCPLTAEGSTLVLERFGTGVDGYLFKFNGTDNTYLHDYASQIGNWNSGSASTDAGSCFLLNEGKLTEEDLALITADYSTVDALLAKYPTGTGLGYYAPTSEMTAAVEAANALDRANTAFKFQPSIDNVVAQLTAAAAGLTLNMPAPGKFYCFKNGSKYLSSILGSFANYDNDGYVDKMTMVSDAAGVTRDVIFYLDSNSKLVAYSNGLFTQNFTTDNYGFEAVGSAGNAVSFEDGAGATPCYHIVCGSRYIYGAQPNGRLDAGGSAPAVGQTGYDWEIEEVTSLPVSVSTAVNYGTLFTPVALAVPAEGVEVYTGTINGEYLHLNPVSGTIPAGTAVVLKYTDAVKTAGSLSFATAADVASISGNVLAGQANTIAASGITNPYTLQNPATGIGFYPYNGTNLNGFKAYMTTGTTTVRGFLFEEDGTTTSIDTLETATPNAQTIYDLSGRRVSKAQKGLYIVNGKKVYIK